MKIFFPCLFFFFFNSLLAQNAIEFIDDTNINSYEELIAPFKGKVVYIDLWASWCAPCRAQLSQKEKLKSLIKGKDVVLLYISTERKEAPWKAAIDEMKIEGYHVRATGALRADLKRLFHNERLGPKYFSLPTYALIDKKGRIVYKDAARPSQTKKLKRQLKKTLRR